MSELHLWQFGTCYFGMLCGFLVAHSAWLARSVRRARDEAATMKGFAEALLTAAGKDSARIGALTAELANLKSQVSA